ncbi:hypothetical protein F511_05855 [Dorcoceras hygrometricum]|uniref:Uncharacterized protein n=1 Tax=Dorcoceras hygrometricum TaxID=472368 RepID=A0A2Z7D3Y7_9LAMI|nr:hypothetical protein F511_05855 [Dorcoceras hygrometricum]
MSASPRVEALISYQGHHEEASSASSRAILANLTLQAYWAVGVPPPHYANPRSKEI